MRRITLILFSFLSISLSAQVMPVIYPALGYQNLTGSDPVVIDTLGYSGTSSGSISPGALRVYYADATSTGYIDSLWTYAATEVAGDSLILCIYADNGSNYPGALLGRTNAYQSNTGAAGWRGYPLQSSVNITSGTRYWLGFRDLNTLFYYQTVGAATRYALPHTWGTALFDPYTAGGASGTASYLLFGKIKD